MEILVQTAQKGSEILPKVLPTVSARCYENLASSLLHQIRSNNHLTTRPHED